MDVRIQPLREAY